MLYYSHHFRNDIPRLAHADHIPDADASKATSMSAVLQQISLALGVAVAGSILRSRTR